MVKVNSPLFSQKASGDLGKAIQFRCGEFVRVKPRTEKKEGTAEQNFQRQKFIDGAVVWKTTLTSEQRSEWENFAKSIRNAKGYFNINIPFGPLWVKIGLKDEWKECIETGGFTGYQYFQCCYLRFGPEGWSDYPNPPPFP